MDPRLIALMQMAQRAKQPVRRFSDGDLVIDDGLSSGVQELIGNMSLPDMNFSNPDFAISDSDIAASLGDIGNLISDDMRAGMDFGGVNVEDIGNLDGIFERIGDTRGRGWAEGEIEDYLGGPIENVQPVGTQPYFPFAANDGTTEGIQDLINQLGGSQTPIDLGGFEDLAESERQSKLQELFGSSIQDLGTQGTLTNEGLLQIGGYDRPGGMTSQWQTSGGDRVIVHDDGTGTGINTETGETYSLDADKVDQMIKNGQLNTYKSGYFEAAGGTKFAPGGGTAVKMNDGSTKVVTTDGKVIDKDTGKVITDTKTIKEVLDKTTLDDQTKKTILGGGGGPKVTGGDKKLVQDKQQSTLSSLLPLLLLMMAMRNKSAPASTATIPRLSAERSVLPYSAIQQAAGYRPGQGGVQYLSNVAYKPMATGGIADLTMASGGTPVGGKLLDGPGDGVSDSIPAVIGTKQPARLARGEFVVDARTVAELGNGSTDAGADKLYQMMDRVHKARKRAKRGQDSGADKYLPA